MKIQITEKVSVTKQIEVDLPYYYKQDLSSDYSDCVIYGKIEEKKYTTIQESISDSKQFQIEMEEYGSISVSGLSSYFNSEFKSSKEEYEAVKIRAQSFLNEL